MNWEAASTIAEIVGAGGVIASLIYLAIQIRHGTKVARAEMTKDLYLASRTAIMDIASNESLARISTEIRQFESKELMQRNMFYQSFFRLYELQYNLKNQGLLDDDIARSYALIIQMWAKTAFFADYWARHRGEFNEAFAAYVDEQVELANAG
ncbi:MAG TPA: hypothetical protein VLA11_08430 [Woeseiaceae bacterium]|jgi:hypothetical protein|nr:hypothetical protein [Woeseiaceae bacterium]